MDESLLVDALHRAIDVVNLDELIERFALILFRFSLDADRDVQRDDFDEANRSDTLPIFSMDALAGHVR